MDSCSDGNLKSQDFVVDGKTLTSKKKGPFSVVFANNVVFALMKYANLELEVRSRKRLSLKSVWLK